MSVQKRFLIKAINYIDEKSSLWHHFNFEPTSMFKVTVIYACTGTLYYIVFQQLLFIAK